MPPNPYDDIPNSWQPPAQPDLDQTAPAGGYHPDAPPPPLEPDDLDDREQQAA